VEQCTHQLNCALEFFPELALAQAKELDAYYEKNQKPIGPLHGLPISLKDQFRIKGLETSMGYVAWIGKYDEEDSVLVTLLRKAGAVFYVKTSVPQSLMVCETVNNIIGRTVNPRNKNWSCGGSSGGEGAIVGFRGGIIGVGTDIGKLPSLERGDMVSKVPWTDKEMVRWLYSSALGFQLSIWSSAEPWSNAIREDGQQYGRTGDRP
jgi:Asp-tRNA(Asn)/Glu-tRNA(Gln) amidotransferase A subunit family amidase